MKSVFICLAAVSICLSCGSNGNGTSSGTDTTQKTAGFSADPAPEPAVKPAALTCLIDGKEWKGASVPGGQLYYAKGITGMYDGLPYLGIAFSSAEAPDDRQLTISFKNFPGKMGVYNKEEVEALLSGSVTGDVKKAMLQGHKMPAQATDFSVVISEWKPVTATEVVVSGTISGTLRGVFDAPDVRIENGSFSNLKVRLYSEKY
jgi:hypothetical protein